MTRGAMGLFTCTVVATTLPGQAYAQHQHDEPAAGDAVIIEVDMRDHEFSPATLRVPAGRSVTLAFRNAGSVAHEFMAGRGVSDGDDRAAGGHDHGGDDHGTMVGLEPGQRATMTFTLPADRRGEWEMACFLPNHYERGMHGSLSVY